jgi:hypothetical protein
MAIPSKRGPGVGLFVASSLVALTAIVDVAVAVNIARGDAPAQRSACQGDNGGLTPFARFLRDHIRRQSRPCPPPCRGAERHALRQHLERPLLS